MPLVRICAARAFAPRGRIAPFLYDAESTTPALAERFAASAPATSRHLSIAETAGLVSSARHDRFVLYRFDRDDPVDTLAGFACGRWPKGRRLRRESRRIAGRCKPA